MDTVTNAPPTAGVARARRHRTRPIGAHDVARAREILARAAVELEAIDPSLRDDTTLFADMLDGEGGDAFDMVRAAMHAALEADAMAEACKTRMADLAERYRRHESRSAGLRGAVLVAMRALGLPQVVDAEFTVSRRAGQARVEIHDPALLPAAYVRTKSEPDKAALSTDLKAGKAIPGAALVQGDETLTVTKR